MVTDRKRAENFNDYIDITVILNQIWRLKFLIFIFALVSGACSYIYVSTLPNIYKTDILLSPVSAKSGGAFGKLSGNLGGLASLAGVSLPSGEDGSVELGLQIMTSRVFLNKFISDNDILLPLMGTEGWKPEFDELIYDKNIYNQEEEIWVRDVKFPFKPKPSIDEAVEVFKEKITISKDKESGLIRISLSHYSPNLAARWTKGIVDSINNYMRTLDRLDAEKGIVYLQTQISKTSIEDERDLLYTMMQEHKKTIMYTEVRKDYLFKVIDPPVIPLIPDSPKRLLILIFLTFIATFLFVIGIVVYTSFNDRKSIRNSNKEEYK